MQKNKVLIIGALPPPYMGPTLATKVILSSFLKDKFDLIHLDVSDHRETDTLGMFDFINLYLGVKSYIDMLYLLIRFRPELTYLQISQTTIGYLRDSIYIILSRLFGLKVLCHLRGGNFKIWYDGCHPLMKWYVRKVHGLVHGQIVLGENLKPLFAGLVDDRRIYVVPNGKDLEYKPQENNNPACKILFAANMVKSKGALDVLHAAKIVCEETDPVEFHFVGGWVENETRAEIEAFVAGHPELPINWHGSLTGQEKDQAYLGADLFVFPTYYPPEGHPWVIVEAMAAGLPIISTDHAAIVESVIDGENGMIVEKRNPVMLADAIIKLTKDDELRKAMGKRSRALYEQNFMEKNMIGKLSDTFNALLGN